MKKHSLQFIFFLTAIICLAPNLSFADHHKDDDGHKRMRGNHLEKMAEDLDLTEEQKTKLKDIHQKFRESKKDLREKLKKAHEELDTTLQSNASDSEVKAKFKALQNLKNQKDELRLEKILATRAILTPEQRKKFKAFKDRRRHHKKHQRFRKREKPDEMEKSEDNEE